MDYSFSFDSFLQVFENIEDAVVTTNSEYVVTSWNRAAERIYGLTDKEAVGRPVQDIINFNYTKIPFSKIVEQLKNKGGWRGEIEHKAPDHQDVWLDLSVSLLIIPEVGPCGTISIAKDITQRKEAERQIKALNETLDNKVAERTAQLEKTNAALKEEIKERKKAEETLREREKMYRVLTENSSDLIWMINLDGSFIYVSPNTPKLSGYTLEEYAQMRVWDLMTPESSSAISAVILNALKNPKNLGLRPHRFQAMHLRKNGETFPVEIIASWMLDDAGRPIGIQGSTRDISDRFYAEEKLRESQRLLSDIIDFLPDATLVVDADGIVIAWNKAIEVMTGVKAETMLGKGNREYALPFYGERRPILIDLALHPDPATESLYASISRHGDFLTGESYIPKLGGGKTFLYATAAVLRNSKGIVTGAIECIRDSTERKQAEEALKASEKKYRELAEAMGDGLCIIEEMEIVYANKWLSSMLGWPIEELIGKSFDRFIEPAYVENIRELFERHMEGEKNIDFVEAEARNKNGDKIYIELNSTIVEHEGVFALLAVIRDVTSRKMTEAALGESEEKFRALTENLNDVIIRFDGNCKILYANQIIESYAGVKPEEITGKEIEDVGLPENFASQLKEAVVDVFCARSIKRAELELKDSLYLDWLIMPEFGTDGSVSIVTCAGRDITERKKVEEELKKHRENLEALVKERTTELKKAHDQLLHSAKMEAVGQLAGGLAHDFNNNLTAILGYAELILRGEPPESAAAKSAETIKKAAQHAAELTQQLLGYARKGKHEITGVDVHAKIKEVVALLSHTLDKKISIALNLEAENAVVMGDPMQIQQALLNLAINGRDAMPGGGELKFETKIESTDETICGHAHKNEVGGYLVIKVSDTGVGIPEEIRDRIFEPFFTTKKPGQGTGMGLAMVYGIVENHGGLIRAESEEGKGSSFIMTLPLGGKYASSSPQIAAELSGSGAIMIVDDEQIVLDIERAMLNELGYQVISFARASDAVDYFSFSQNDVDLAILDMVMPEMDGRECYAALKKIKPDVKVILASGYSIEGRIKQIMEEGVAAFIQKPFTIETLGAKVKEALGREK